MTRHHVTANFNPGEPRLVLDGLDISRSVTKAGTHIDFDDKGWPVLTVQTAPGVTIDVDLEDAEVRVHQVRPLKALGWLALAGIEGDDAITALDAFIERAARHILAEVDDKTVTPEGRAEMLVTIFGSDAVRVASVLSGGVA